MGERAISLIGAGLPRVAASAGGAITAELEREEATAFLNPREGEKLLA